MNPNPSVLVVEDSPESQLLIKNTLLSDAQVVCAISAAEAIRAIEKHHFDLILVDVMLPGDDGFHFCAHARQIRNVDETEIVFITSRDGLRDKILAFSLGADDYVVKPFDPLELRARIQSRLRRIRMRKQSTASLVAGDLRLCIQTRRAFLKEADSEMELDLSPTEFRLLHFLVQRGESVSSRQTILDSVWGNQRHVLERTVDSHVYVLRRKLGARAHYIQSVLGAGYRFVAP